MTYALAWRVVAQSVDPEHGVEEARIFTTVLMVTAPCAAPTSNRHQNQVARQRAAASLCAASRASLTAPCVRIVAADSREVDRHHHSRRHRGGERHLVGWLRDSRRLSAPHARKRAASGGCQVPSRAARRPSMWPRRRVFTAVYVGPLGWTAHAFAAPLMGAALVAFAACLRSSCCEKSLLRCVFLRAWRCGRGVCAADALNAPLHTVVCVECVV